MRNIPDSKANKDLVGIKENILYGTDTGSNKN